MSVSGSKLRSVMNFPLFRSEPYSAFHHRFLSWCLQSQRPEPFCAHRTI